ncbi:hypothetical protein [Falsiphaeobacter marinintestinus]|uniref:hypothetical protein n=1 Tax=Falsiphaeobacter marinintestinus TaxID=1492905 RepID=UPI0011B3ED88|nr:hypothetical protein [Phaeobacter marinintestinus]
MSAAMNILGVVRNGGESLPATLDAIEALRTHLPASRVIIATNDNSDGTDAVLADYCARADNVTLLRLDGEMTNVEERVERITLARNATLFALFDGSVVHPLTLVLDLDGPNSAMPAEDVLKSAGRVDIQWDGLFANQERAYYDIYALRCPGWCEEDVWQTIHAVPKPLFFRKKRHAALLARLIYDRQFHIPRNTPPIPVDSAFGGLGLYKTEALRGLRYAARDANGNLTCEHVTLHRAMRDRGANLFIDPALLNTTQHEHLGPSSGAPLPEALLKETL